MPGVRVNLVRTVYRRLLQMRPGSVHRLGEYQTDAIGGCDVLEPQGSPAHTPNLSSAALLRAPVRAGSALGALFDGAFAPMAEQCALARLDEPVVCCRHGGAPHCGTQICDNTWARVNRGFARRAQEWTGAGGGRL